MLVFKSCSCNITFLLVVVVVVVSSAVRPQFGHWLLEQVQSFRYDGLHMIDRDTFRIPWKHNSRKDCGDEDNRIFREWAVVSGKINEYPNDKAKWKTNFRCALNSLTQFKLIHDNSKDSENPHKIYRIIHPEMPQPIILPSVNELEITIHYRRTEMLKMHCASSHVQLHSQCDQSELRGISVQFPSTADLTDQKQVQYTKRLLDNIKRGLLLEVCSSDLMDFKENRRGSPDYTIYLCFGEKFPDGKPLERKLIVVKVVPLICRELHKAAQLEGASSLHNDNISLQISHNSLYDLIEASFSPPPAI
ncbi:interferon regulatory factor 7 [Clarias magur]|uniref:Interferon regulatory factor 7 n=1 Tax=Clarias magur TaxID=1594786 RepID=A0A8J4UPD7_CLAMG|nr:interferon regulatory factor 7 [Clarias magur]